MEIIDSLLSGALIGTMSISTASSVFSSLTLVMSQALLLLFFKEDRFETLVAVLTRLKSIKLSSLNSLDVFWSTVLSVSTLNKFSLEVLCIKSILSDLSSLSRELPLALSFSELVLNCSFMRQILLLCLDDFDPVETEFCLVND